MAVIIAYSKAMAGVYGYCCTGNIINKILLNVDQKMFRQVD